MSAQETDPMANEAFDARLRRLLELDTADISTGSSRDEAIIRLASAVGLSEDAGTFSGRTAGQPVLRTILVLGLMGVLIAGVIAVGARLVDDDLLVAAPSHSPATASADPAQPAATATAQPTLAPSPAPLVASLCPGGTRANDIRNLSQPVSTEPRWVSDPPPTAAGPIAPREIAVVGRATTDDTSRGVYLLDLATGASCLLVELPPGGTVANIMWAPSGDALALGVNGPVRGESVTLVWSALGITAPIVDDTVLWAPDGSSVLAFGPEPAPSGLQLVPEDGSAPLLFECEPGRTDPCPAVPRVHWSPDGSRISLHGGDRWGPRLFSIAALADRQMRPLDTGLEDPDIVGWLDANTLLVASRDDLFRVPIDDPRASTPYEPGTFPASDSRHDKFSPDLAFAALEPVEFGDGLDLVDLASGRATTAVSPADVGDDLAIYQFEWAPTSDAFAFALTSEPYVQNEDGSDLRAVVPGLWVVNRDGTGLRQVSTFPIETSEGAPTFAWRPAWP
jgi:hypothetical protein